MPMACSPRAQRGGKKFQVETTQCKPKSHQDHAIGISPILSKLGLEAFHCVFREKLASSCDAEQNATRRRGTQLVHDRFDRTTAKSGINEQPNMLVIRLWWL